MHPSVCSLDLSSTKPVPLHCTPPHGVVATHPPTRPHSRVSCLQMPTVDQAKAVTELLRERSQVPDYVFKVRGTFAH